VLLEGWTGVEEDPRAWSNTMGGANAVDGVIQVITKKAKSTQSAGSCRWRRKDERADRWSSLWRELGRQHVLTEPYTKYFDWAPSAYPRNDSYEAGIACEEDFARIGRRPEANS